MEKPSMSRPRRAGSNCAGSAMQIRVWIAPFNEHGCIPLGDDLRAKCHAWGLLLISPLQGWKYCRSPTHGVAMGYHILPRWGSKTRGL